MRLFAIIRREAITIRRDPRSLFLVVFSPLMLLIIYGYAVTFDIDHIPIAVYDQSRGPKSRELIEKFSSSRYFTLEWIVDSRQGLDELLVNDQIIFGIIIPPDFGSDIKSGKEGAIQILVNGSDPNTATMALGYQALIFGDFIKSNFELPPGMKIASVESRIRIWYNSEMKSSNFIVPGVIAIVMMILGAILTASTIVREKETGTIEQIIASPIKPWEYILGKISPHIAVSLFDVVLVVAAAFFIFNVPIRGSLLCLGFFSLLFLSNALGIGLFVSAVSKNIAGAQIMATLISLLPSILLSGFIFPIDSMPKVIRAITYLVPARYFLEILRGIFLKGVGFMTLWPQGLFLMANALLFLWLASMKFEKKLG